MGSAIEFIALDTYEIVLSIHKGHEHTSLILKKDTLSTNLNIFRRIFRGRLNKVIDIPCWQSIRTSNQQVLTPLPCTENTSMNLAWSLYQFAPTTVARTNRLAQLKNKFWIALSCYRRCRCLLHANERVQRKISCVESSRTFDHLDMSIVSAVFRAESENIIHYFL